MPRKYIHLESYSGLNNHLVYQLFPKSYKWSSLLKQNKTNQPTPYMGWGDGSMVISACCSRGGACFVSQHPQVANNTGAEDGQAAEV